MNQKLKYIFGLILVFSVFSLSLQASIASICKENKIVKNQDTSKPFSEEESSDDSDEETDEKTDKELLYLQHGSLHLLSQKDSHVSWDFFASRFQIGIIRIPVPPPRF